MSLNESLSTYQSPLLEKEQLGKVLQAEDKQQKEVSSSANKQEQIISVSPSEYENEFGEDMIMPTVNQTQINAERDKQPSQIKKMKRLNRKNAIIMQDSDFINQEQTKSKGVKSATKDKSLKYSKQGQLNKLKISLLERNQASISSPQSQRIKEMQEKIKQIAKSIRQKIKKDGEKQSSHIHRQKKNRLPQHPKQLKKMQNRNIALSPLNKQLVSPGDALQSSSTLITSLEHQLKTVDPKIIIKDIVKNDIFHSMWKAIQNQQKMNKYKLKLDPIKHRYPLTSFRKVILEQCKKLSQQQENKIKDRQEKLMKRKLIYNSSRFDRYIKQQKGKQSLSLKKPLEIIQNQINGETVMNEAAIKEEQHIQNPEFSKQVKIEQKNHFGEQSDNQQKKDTLLIQAKQQPKQTILESEQEEYYF